MWVDLPDVAWDVILSYVGNTKDFRHCEMTCRSLRRILSNEALWNIWESQWPVPSLPEGVGHCTTETLLFRQAPCSYGYQGESPWIPPPLPADGSKTSLRENCLGWQAFGSARESLKSTDSIIFSVLGMTRWKQFVKAVMAHGYADVPFQASHGFHERTSNHTSHAVSPVEYAEPHVRGGEWGWGDMRVSNTYTLRGDGSSALLNVVESCIITQLARAMRIAINAKRTMVMESNFITQAELFPTDGYLNA